MRIMQYIYLEDVNSLQIDILSGILVGVSILWNGEKQIYFQFSQIKHKA